MCNESIEPIQVKFRRWILDYSEAYTQVSKKNNGLYDVYSNGNLETLGYTDLNFERILAIVNLHQVMCLP